MTDELEQARIRKAIAALAAEVATNGGKPDVVFIGREAADEMGVDYTPAYRETAEGNE